MDARRVDVMHHVSDYPMVLDAPIICLEGGVQLEKIPVKKVLTGRDRLDDLIRFWGA